MRPARHQPTDLECANGQDRYRCLGGGRLERRRLWHDWRHQREWTRSVGPQIRAARDRVLRNAFNSTWEGRTTEINAHRAELQQVLAAGAQAQDPAVVDISAGVAVRLIHSLEPAGAIVQRIVAEAEALLRQRSAPLVR